LISPDVINAGFSIKAVKEPMPSDEMLKNISLQQEKFSIGAAPIV
jgi:hypothetical protein